MPKCSHRNPIQDFFLCLESDAEKNCTHTFCSQSSDYITLLQDLFRIQWARNQINKFHEIFFTKIPFFATSKMVKYQFLN